MIYWLVVCLWIMAACCLLLVIGVGFLHREKNELELANLELIRRLDAAEVPTLNSAEKVPETEPCNPILLAFGIPHRPYPNGLYEIETASFSYNELESWKWRASQFFEPLFTLDSSRGAVVVRELSEHSKGRIGNVENVFQAQTPVKIVEGEVVQTADKLSSTDGMLIAQKYLDQRQANAMGTLKSYVPGHGGDVWFVEHINGEIAAYAVNEFMVIGK